MRLECWSEVTYTEYFHSLGGISFSGMHLLLKANHLLLKHWLVSDWKIRITTLIFFYKTSNHVNSYILPIHCVVSPVFWVGSTIYNIAPDGAHPLWRHNPMQWQFHMNTLPSAPSFSPALVCWVPFYSPQSLDLCVSLAWSPPGVEFGKSGNNSTSVTIRSLRLPLTNRLGGWWLQFTFLNFICEG